MKRFLATFFLILAFAGTAVAKKTYSITLKVDEEKNIESQHSSFRFNRYRGVYGHSVTTHIFATGSDGNAYDLVPKNRKDFVVPGTYDARFDKRNVILLVNGREIKTIIVEVKAAQ